MVKRMSREARKGLILSIMRRWQDEGWYECTAHDLAKEMSICASSHLNSILVEMCDDCLLDCEPVVYRGIAGIRFVYSLGGE
jgi:hypothetical protein